MLKLLVLKLVVFQLVVLEWFVFEWFVFGVVYASCLCELFVLDTTKK